MRETDPEKIAKGSSSAESSRDLGETEFTTRDGVGGKDRMQGEWDTKEVELC